MLSGRHDVALALQGGGSHGAFTWGVLDRFLEEAAINIIGVTGTSAGALNAAALVDGMVAGGRDEARRRLRQFWEATGKIPGFGSFLWPMSGESAAALNLERTPVYWAWQTICRALSPYQSNPFNYNPLREPLTKLIDFDRLRTQQDIRLVVAATNVRTARRRVFTNKDVSVDSLLASACTPQLLPAVEIDGEAYWDGGFTGNPALAEMMRTLPDCDLAIVRIDPFVREEVPRSIENIFHRTVEISFNSTFWLELGALAVISSFVDEGLLSAERFRRTRIHMIDANPALAKFAPSSKLNNYPALLEYLFDLGRQTADVWLAEHAADIGQRSTIDLEQFLPWPIASREGATADDGHHSRPLAGDTSGR
jgi:NTE family protein